MLRFPKNNTQQVEAILEVIKHERSKGQPSVGSINRLAKQIFKIWEQRNNDTTYQSIPRSAMLRRSGSMDGVIDHPFPQEQLAKLFLTMSKEDYRISYVSRMLYKFAFFCLITPEEKNDLIKAGIDNKMPKTWNKIDRYARYTEVGITMGEIEFFNNKDLYEILKKTIAPFYVYRLMTPAKKVFYIGKGEKFRALSHEKEIFKRTFRTHTNWKKLNKIARILHSGKAIVYEIESWHYDETEALLREDELILISERNNSRALCNSNGSRWKGKPNRQLLELRAEQGLT